MFFTQKYKTELEELRRLYNEVLEIVKDQRPIAVLVGRDCGHESVSYAMRKDGTTLCLDCYKKQFEVKE